MLDASTCKIRYDGHMPVQLPPWLQYLLPKRDRKDAVHTVPANVIHDVVKQRLVRVVYQPIVTLTTRKIYAYEALLRSLSPAYNSPLPLLDDAVAAGLMGELGRTLREMSTSGCVHYPLFLNLHPNEFDEGWLVRPDDPMFWHEPGVFVEITESVPLSHFALCKSVLKEIRSRGLALAVDDLGAGFSNLKYISDLNPEVVKVDRELIAGVDQHKRQQRLLKSIVALCQEMGAKVVAEGIETVEELKVVMDAGADYGQGFLLARPNFPPPEVHWPE